MKCKDCPLYKAMMQQLQMLLGAKEKIDKEILGK